MNEYFTSERIIDSMWWVVSGMATGLAGLFIYLLNREIDRIDKLEAEMKEATEALSQHKEEVARNYVTNDVFERATDRMVESLEGLRKDIRGSLDTFVSAMIKGKK